MKIGAQLYTVREFTQNEKDFEDTVKKIADIGYEGVQVSAVGPISAEKIADICKCHKLEIASTHIPPARILNDTCSVIAEHKLYETKQIGIGIMPSEYQKSTEDVIRFIEDFKPAAKSIKDAGMCFAYHNHDFEFEKYGGKLILEHILDGFSENELQIILDLYWVQAGGADPVFWIKKLAGRLTLIHFKDMAIVNRERRFAEVGSGNLNWSAIIDACKEVGVKWAMVEQDDSYGKDPFNCLQESYKFLAKHLLH